MNSEKNLYTVSSSYRVDEGNNHLTTGITPEIRFEATLQEAKEFFKSLYRLEFIRHYEDGSLDVEDADLEETLNDLDDDLDGPYMLRYQNDDGFYVEETFTLNLSGKDYLTETEILKKTEEMNAEYRAFAEQKGFDLDEF